MHTTPKSFVSRLSSLSTLGMIVLGVVIFMLINLSARLLLGNLRFDLTENSIYTISDGTIATLKKLDEPVTLRLFASEALQNLPGLQAYEVRVEGLLEQLAAHSSGKLRVQFIRPEPFSPEEDQAVAFGLRPTPINNSQVLFGLVVTNYLDKSQVLPFLTPEREPFLEYDITKAIDELIQRDRPKVGLLNYVDFGQNEQPGEPIAFSQLRDQYNLVEIERDATSLPQGLDVLVLIHPTNDMPPALVYAVDQFFINNGKLVMAVDPLLQNAQPAPDSPTLPASNPSSLFDGWGITFTGDQVVADPLFSLRVNMQTANGLEPINHPSWLQYGPDNLSQQDIVSGELNQLRVISAGSLGLKDGTQGIVFTSLLNSSDSAGIIRSLIMSQPSPQLWQSSYKPKGEQSIIARYSGVFNSSQNASGDGHLAKSPNASNLLVFADIDMFVDRFWVQVQNFLGQQLTFRSADNGVMLLNAVDNMASSSNLISLRSRGIRERRFDVVSELRQKASVQFQQRQDDLEEQLHQTEQRINQLQSQADDNNQLLLSAAQQGEIQRFQQQRANTRQQLRELQLRLNRDIEKLGLWLKLFCIALLPLLLLLLAMLLPSRLRRT